MGPGQRKASAAQGSARDEDPARGRRSGLREGQGVEGADPFAAHVLVARRRSRDEAGRTGAVEDEDSVWHERVEVDVQRSPEPLHRGDAPVPWIGRPQPPRGPSLPGEDGAGEEVEQTRGEGRVAGGEEANAPREGEDPLPDGDGGQDVPDEVLGGVLHISKYISK